MLPHETLAIKDFNMFSKAHFAAEDYNSSFFSAARNLAVAVSNLQIFI
jgi:hypothetical protein